MNLRRFTDISLKYKLIIPFLFLAVTGATSLFVVSYNFENSLIHVNEEKRLRNLYHFFLNDIEFKKNMAMSLATLVAKDCNVAEAFAHRDRERLIELLKPAYETLHRDFNVQQFHFHTDHATSFLRLHALDNLECCGEVMESFRKDITEAFTTCRGCGGVELGTFGLSIRSVVPVFYEEKIVGTFEVGLSIEEPFLKNFKRHYGTDVFLYIEDNPDTCKMKMLASTITDVNFQPDRLDRCFASGEQLLNTGKINGLDMVMIAGPIYDFSSDIKAVVEIAVDRSPTKNLLKKYTVITAAIALAGLLLSMSFVWFVSSLFCKRIGDVVKGAQEIATGSRNQIEVKSHDELGWMALAINQMLTSLEVSRNKLSEYARDLEVMVDERTKTLKESETTYRTLIENVPIIVYMAMADGTIIFLNKHIKQMLDQQPSFFSGNHQVWDNYIHPRDRERVVQCREKSLSNGEELHLNYRMVKDNGQVVYAADHAVAVFDEKNNFVRMDGIIVDVTVQKKLHEERLQAEELATLSQISSRLAHELRNPLTAIGGLSRLLVKSFDAGDSRRKKADLIIEQVVKLEKILQMILTYLGPQHFALEAADFNSVVTEAVEMINMQLDNNKISVTLSLDRTIGTLELDIEQFKSCLISLMENAFKRMGGEGIIHIWTKKIGEHATVTLSYTVPYITDDDISDFFFPFIVTYPFTYSEDDEDIMNVPVCKRIIHNHCGMITVSKEVDNNLCIDISLPLER